MSDATLARVEAAIQAHIADENPGIMLGGFIVVATGQSLTDLDDRTITYPLIWPERQAPHVSMGLLHHATVRFNASTARAEDEAGD